MTTTRTSRWLIFGGVAIVLMNIAQLVQIASIKARLKNVEEELKQNGQPQGRLLSSLAPGLHRI